jgi:WD40 repeat protein
VIEREVLRRWTLGTIVAAGLLFAPAWANTPHQPHRPHTPRAGGGGGGGGTPPPVGPGGTNLLMAPAAAVELPGMGTTLAWAPDGHAIAIGGHFSDPATTMRYDTKVYDLAANAIVKSFDCHYYWTVGEAWTSNPYVGEVIVDGAGDHAVKVWRASAPGSTRCAAGQFRAVDGALVRLLNVNGWVTSLAFSPDGRFLAGASRDRTIRIWQVAPGENQWKVVRLWYDYPATNFVSVAWAPHGHALVTGDRSGRVAVWTFDPSSDLWDADMIARYAAVAFVDQPGWFAANAALLARTPLWSEGGHRQVWRARYSPDGTRVAAVGGDGALSVFDAASGAVVYRTGLPAVTPLYGLDWSPDGATLAVGAADHTIRLFAAADGAAKDVLVGHTDGVTAVAWSPDGRTLASTAAGPLLSELTHALVAGPDPFMRLWTRR